MEDPSNHDAKFDLAKDKLIEKYSRGIPAEDEEEFEMLLEFRKRSKDKS